MAEVTRLRRRHENWTRGGPVVSDMDETEITALGDRAAATVADPTPMGLWVFATGTWILGTIYAGVFPALQPAAPGGAATATSATSASTAAIPVLMIVAGAALFIAGLFAYRRASLLSATAFCCFGALYFATALFFYLQSNGMLALTGDPLVIQGFVLVSFGFMALALTIAALRTNMGWVAVLATLCVGLILIGISHLRGHAPGAGGAISDIGGWFLWASAFCAYYTGAALIVNSIWEQTTLPIGGEP